MERVNYYIRVKDVLTVPTVQKLSCTVKYTRCKSGGGKRQPSIIDLRIPHNVLCMGRWRRRAKRDGMHCHPWTNGRALKLAIAGDQAKKYILYVSTVPYDYRFVFACHQANKKSAIHVKVRPTSSRHAIQRFVQIRPSSHHKGAGIFILRRQLVFVFPYLAVVVDSGLGLSPATKCVFSLHLPSAAGPSGLGNSPKPRPPARPSVQAPAQIDSSSPVSRPVRLFRIL